MADTLPGKLVIVSGPSGVGKSTIVKRLIEICPLPLELSISATTRPIRQDDRPGENYVFMKPEEFHKRVKNGEFLECVEVFGRGYWYGTRREQVISGLESGKWIILEIDVEGAAEVLKSYPTAITIFVHAGSIEELEKRLRRRGTEDEQSIKRRIEVAMNELEASSIYEHIVINQSVEQTVREICELLKKNADLNRSVPCKSDSFKH